MSNEPNKPNSGVPPEALTPAVQAYMNAQLKETVAAMFREFAPMMQSIALTPEKIQAMEDARRAPTAEVIARKARELRERKMQQAGIEEANQRRQALQDNCPHKYSNGQLSLAVISNRPDRQRLLICLKNHCMIVPGMWMVSAPTEEHPRGRVYFEKPHPDYRRLIQEYDTAHQEG
jgi:hypothetical protein